MRSDVKRIWLKIRMSQSGSHAMLKVHTKPKNKNILQTLELH